MSAVIPSRAEELRRIPLTQLVESRTNPRTVFERTGLDELAASIKAQGIIEPLVVRPRVVTSINDFPFEIVAGARRFRAAKLAKAIEVPAIVRQLSNDEVLKIQLIENLQREGMTPLEEARGYQRLRDEAKQTVEQIAAGVGKSNEHIYARLKLLALDAKPAQALAAGKISAEHGVLLARLPAKDQEIGLARVTDQHNPMNVRRLRDWVKERDDVNKTQQRVEGEISAARAKGEKVVKLLRHAGATPYTNGALSADKYTLAGKAKCKHLARGFYLENQLNGRGYSSRYEGSSTLVCTSPATCPAHKPKTVTAKRSPAEISYARQRRAEEVKRRADQLGEGRAIAALIAKVRGGMGAGKHELQLIVGGLLSRLWSDNARLICQRRGWEPKKRQYGNPNYEPPIAEFIGKASVRDLVRLGVEMAVMSDGKLMTEASRRYKINVAGFRRKALTELKAKTKKVKK